MEHHPVWTNDCGERGVNHEDDEAELESEASAQKRRLQVQSLTLATLAKPVDKGKNKKQKKYLNFFPKKETKERKKRGQNVLVNNVQFPGAKTHFFAS